MLKLLEHERCLAVSSFFEQAADGTSSVTGLAQELSERDVGRPESLRIALRYSVLPRLAEACVAEYDARSNVVHYDGPTWVEQVLERVAAIPEIEPGDDRG